MSTLAAPSKPLAGPAPALREGAFRLLSDLRAMAEAVREGLSAARHYEQLTLRGVAPADAARAVFTAHYQDR